MKIFFSILLAFWLPFVTIGQIKLDLDSDSIVTCKSVSVQRCVTNVANLLPTPVNDDIFTDTIDLGFNFSFFGTNYSQCVISPNNFISFNLSLSGTFSEWNFSSAATANQLDKSILFPFQDLNVTQGGPIKYKTVGVAPYRKFVVEFCSMPYFFCPAVTTSNQLILYETTNIIEMHLGNKPICIGWSGSTTSYSVQGLRSGATQMYVPGRGPADPNWSTANTATRFSPAPIGTGYSISTVAYNPIELINPNTGSFNWYAQGNSTPFSTSPCATITTNQSTDYYVVEYTGPIGCSNPNPTTVTDTVHVLYTNIPHPISLTYCSNDLPATWNGMPIPVGTTSQANYDTVIVPTLGCDSVYIVDLVINTLLTPAFTQIQPICSDVGSFSLPTTSINGISGTWSPSANFVATTTYTFTPNPGQCSNTTTMTVQVNPSLTASFNPLTPICAGDNVPPLSTTSNNGITGTWSPSILDNNNTNNYTFTPTASNTCLAGVTLTLYVTPKAMPIFNGYTPICSGSALAPLPSTSINGFQGTWSPALNNTATTTYTFTPNAGQCAFPTTLTIVVNNNTTASNFSPIGPICVGDTLLPLPTTSANGIVGTWSPALNNTNTTTYSFTPTNVLCGLPTSLTIVVNPLIVPTFTQIPPICQGSIIPSPLLNTSNNGYAGTWSPAFNANSTTVYTFTPNIGQGCILPTTMTIQILPSIFPLFTLPDTLCSTVTGFSLPPISNDNVTGTWSPAFNPSATTTYIFTPTPSAQCYAPVVHTIYILNPITPTFNPILPQCAGLSTPLSTTSLEGIVGTWSPAFNNMATASYTFTPNANQCAVSIAKTVVINPNNTIPLFNIDSTVCLFGYIASLPTTSLNGIVGSWSQPANSSSTATYIFTPLAGQCATTTTHTITVLIPQTPLFAPVAPICIGQALSPLPTTSTNGYTGTWSPALNNLATTTYTFTTANGQCATNGNLTITINPNVVPTFSILDTICNNLTVSPLSTTSNNGFVGTWSPAFNNSATTVYTFTPVASSLCPVPTIHTLHVKPPQIPTFNGVGPFCAGTAIAVLPTTSLEGIQGTWSPAINNSVTTQYTFTPNAGFCATQQQLTITISANSVIPTFDTIPNICAGSLAPPLPLVSNNGIFGTWSPATINNLATGIYTFTPTNCGSVTTLLVVVDSIVEPYFTPVPPICSGSPLSPLPAVSNNGIKGNWSPAMNNTATTQYIFTPLSGSCADTASMTIVVNPIVTPSFVPVGPYCANAAIPALPLTSTNGVTGTWTPAINNQATTTYSFVANPGTCVSGTVTMTIVVNPITTPTFTNIGAICSGAALSPLPTTSINGISGSWSPAINNTTTTTYTFTPAAGQCASVVTMTIPVNSIVTPTFTPIAPICAGGSLSPLPTGSLNGITGTWAPALNNSTTTQYHFTPTSGGCADTTSMTIVVNPIVTPSFNPVGPYCANALIPALPLTSTNGITGTWTPAINNQVTTTYSFVANPGTCVAGNVSMTIIVNPNTTPTFTNIGAICSGATLSPLPTTSINGISGSWSPAINNTTTTTYTFTPAAGQCASVVTMTIPVTPIVTPTFTPVAPICAGGSLSPLPTGSLNGITGTWAPALNNSTTTQYHFTPTSGGCADTTSMTIVVNPIVTPSFNPVGPYCANALIPALPLTSTNGITGTWTPAINNQATTTYSFVTTAGPCVVDTTLLTIVVNPILNPTFQQISPICAGGTLNALPLTSSNGVSGTWSPALNNTTTTTYTFTPNAGTCATSASMTIVVSPNVTPVFSPIAPVCQGTPLAPLPTTSTNGVTGTWSPNLNNNATTTYTFTPNGLGTCQLPTTMQIVINPYLYGTRNVTICANSSYTFNGISYTSSVSGVLDTIANSNTCDSVISLNLTVNPLSYGNQVVSICQGSSYSFNGQLYFSNNNTAKDTLVNQYGCDSIVTLQLTVIPIHPTTASSQLEGCTVVNFKGHFYTTDTTFIDTTYTSFGCDSNYNTVRIKVYPSYNVVEETKINGCNRVEYNGVVYSHDAYFEEAIKTSHGCDSFIHKVSITVDSFDLKLEMDPLIPYRNEEVRFKTTATPSNSFTVLSWQPSSLFSNQSAYNQRIIIDTPMTVTVIAQLGRCMDTVSVTIFNLPEIDTNFKMPNAFSPNGDGINDVFRPVLKAGHGYNFADFSIYNRYGQRIYNTNSIASGWDGYYKGVLQDAGVYYYRVAVKFADGTTKVYNGDVTLIK